MTAHRQDLPFDERITAWNDVDSGLLAWFVEHAAEALDALHALDPRVQRFTPLATDLDPGFLGRFGAVREPPGIRVAADSLNLTRGQLSLIPGDPQQQRAAEILSIYEMVGTTAQLLRASTGNRDADRLFKSMAVIDACNLVDCLYGVGGLGPQAQAGLLQIFDQTGSNAAAVLRAAAAAQDKVVLTRIREVRDRAAAHVDGGLPLKRIVDMLDRLDLGDVDRILVPGFTAFEHACDAEFTMKVFRTHGALMQGVVGVIPTDAQRPFDS